MTSSLHPYPEYMDSGLQWLGKVPRHWHVKRGKCLYRCIDVRSTDGREELLTVSSAHGVIPRRTATVTMFKAESYTGYKLCWPGDLVINSLWAWSFGLGVSTHHGIVSSAYGVYRLQDPRHHPEYFGALTRSVPFNWELKVRSKGIWISRLQLTDQSFLDAPLPIPPPDEQDAIVRFLRSIDIKVIRFIRNRRRLIEVFNEQKQAIINRAVTRGLDPNVSLKSSGVEWVEDIPMHWEVRRLRNVAEMRVSNVDKHVKEGETPVRLCNYTDVYKNPVITANMPFMQATATAVEVDAFRLRVGDVIITKDSEEWQDIGVPALVAEAADDLICGYHLAILRPRASVASGRFLAYALQSRAATTQLSLAANGVTRYGLSHGAIKAISIAVPPPDEQAHICEHIDAATASLNAAIRRAQREIDLICEYRTRLVADVVTGKVDVRGLAPTEPIPEEPDTGIDVDDETIPEDGETETGEEVANDVD